MAPVSCLVRPNCGFCTNYVLAGGATSAAFRFTWLDLGCGTSDSNATARSTCPSCCSAGAPNRSRADATPATRATR